MKQLLQEIKPIVSKEALISFETDIKTLYLEGKIRAPIHLAGGNEDELLRIFQQIKPNDWVVSTYRNHYHALLKGIDPEWLKTEILKGHSMHIMSKDHKFISSSIVAGGLPIALGLALGIFWKGGNGHVWCFLGDMAATTGTFAEVSHYAGNFQLPITFIIEDNGHSVNTPTSFVWGIEGQPDIQRYPYKSVWPHAGAGQWVKF